MRKLLLILMLGMFLFSFTSAFLGVYKQDECVELKTILNTSEVNISTISFPDSSFLILNAPMEKNGYTFNYSFCNTSLLGVYIYDYYDSEGNVYSNDFEINPTGVLTEDLPQISSAILYLYVILGLGFTFLGYLFMRNRSLWITYSGLFIMILGFTFFYYALHLSNLFAQTIAINSGAQNVTSGAFMIILRFIKIAPYIVAGIIAFASVKLLNGAIKGRRNSDGWDGNAY